MIQKTLLFRNLVDNIPKNIGLYMIGAILLVADHFSFDPITIGLGLIAFLFSYSSIYVMNDLFDVAEDMKNGEKAARKPLANGTVTKNEAFVISIMLLAIGILLSFLLNLIFLGVVCLLIITNYLYSVPPSRLKHTFLGLPLVLVMQIMKILLPWTTSVDLNYFPTLFVLSFSLIYLIIFVGYKQNKTIGASVREEPVLFGLSILVLITSILLYPSPLFQMAIICYLLAGIVFFRDVRLTDMKVIKLSPVYILLGVFLFVYLIMI
jgi:4-hydroxybenzoate polyprenyltransferase